MDLNYFLSVPFIQTIKDISRWTVSTKNKMPIDMNALRYRQVLIGATFKNDNQPLVTLEELQQIIPNPTNTAFNLNQSLDNFVVLDIEPKCPPEIRDRLLTLPYKYCELSMSGYGFHLVFDKPKTNYEAILLSKPALKEEHGYYEILLNHYVTFTGRECKPSENCVFADISEFEKLVEDLASKAKIQHSITLDTDDLPNLEDIELGDDIVNLLSQAKYNKTVSNFEDDYSAYEFGVAGFYYKKLKMLLSTTKYKKHEYSNLEKMVLLYNIIVEIIPYREKHETVRDGLPWIMYTCKRVVTTGEQS